MIEVEVTTWDDAQPVVDEQGWALLEENGFDLRVAYFAPAGHIGRRPVDDSIRTVAVVTVASDGTRSRRLESFTPDDRAEIDESINDYLNHHQIPSLPPGYRWFLRVPPQWAADAPYLSSLIGRALEIERNEEENFRPAVLALFLQAWSDGEIGETCQR